MSAPDVRAQAADLIDNAIDVLHEHGWCQGGFRDSDNRVCMAEAVHAVTRETYNTRSETLAWSALHAAVDGPLTWFNDADGTTVEDVVLTMKQAAASLREPQP